MLSGTDRVSSKLANCIKVAESTLQNKEQKSGGGICGGAGETNPWLVQMGLSISRIPQSPSPNNVELFMDAMASPPKHPDPLWELAKLKKGKAKAPEQSSDSIFLKNPGLSSLNG